MGAMLGGGGGGKGGGGGGGGGIFGGLSPFDVAMAQQAGSQNAEAIHNRYQQLGIGIPGGDPMNPTYGGASKMKKKNLAQNQHATGATVAEMENFSRGLPPGTLANLAQQQQQQQNNDFSSGAESILGQSGGSGGAGTFTDARGAF